MENLKSSFKFPTKKYGLTFLQVQVFGYMLSDAQEVRIFIILRLYGMCVLDSVKLLP